MNAYRPTSAKKNEVQDTGLRRHREKSEFKAEYLDVTGGELGLTRPSECSSMTLNRQTAWFSQRSSDDRGLACGGDRSQRLQPRGLFE
jgi:hypothetical protein